jgi:thioesterase domain-containing protein
MSIVKPGIRLLRSSHDGPVLFCLYRTHFESLAAQLPAHLTIYGLPGTEDAGFAGTSPSVEQLARQHLAEVRKTQPEGPYRLLGYSFGGLVAYEMAVQLHREGAGVSLLALFDTPHPNFRGTLSPQELELARRVYRADRIKKYLTNLRNGRLDRLVRDVLSLVQKQLRPLTWTLQARVRRATAGNRFTASRNAGIAFMWHSYTPPDFEGSVLLIRAQGRDAEFAPDPTMGWRNCAGEVDVRFATGSHEVMMDGEHATQLAGLLMPWIQTDSSCASAAHGD